MFSQDIVWNELEFKPFNIHYITGVRFPWGTTSNCSANCKSIHMSIVSGPIQKRSRFWLLHKLTDKKCTMPSFLWEVNNDVAHEGMQAAWESFSTSLPLVMLTTAALFFPSLAPGLRLLNNTMKFLFWNIEKMNMDWNL